MIEGKTKYLKGFRNDFLCTDRYNTEFFEKVLQLKQLSNWEDINYLMKTEFMFSWNTFLLENGINTNKESEKEEKRKENDKTLNWQQKHFEVIKDFLLFLNRHSNRFILKDSTSLMMCYGLTRFSEDIDLDGFDKSGFFKIIDQFIFEYSKKYNKITVRRAKDTDTVKRAFIHYGGEKPLKINAFRGRDKLRDLYDVTFIYLNYKNILSSNIINDIKDVIWDKGIEQFDYLIKNQPDELIDSNKLAEDFLTMYYDLGLG